MSALEIRMFPAFTDNYGYLLHDGEAGVTGCVDTPDAPAIKRALSAAGWHLTHIFNTHHHFDHAGGNLELKEKYGCTIIGPLGEADAIPGIDRAVGEGDTVVFGSHEALVFDVPGHTSGHIAYWFAEDKAAFVGDTLFALGCGRLFEGTPEDMWTSLQKLMALPDDTRVYCAHEYTEANARFAVTVEPGNRALKKRYDEIRKLRARQEPTVPSTIGLEKATNPFLRPMSEDLQHTLGLVGAPLVDVFAETRRRKDNF